MKTGDVVEFFDLLNDDQIASAFRDIARHGDARIFGFLERFAETNYASERKRVAEWLKRQNSELPAQELAERLLNGMPEWPE